MVISCHYLSLLIIIFSSYSFMIISLFSLFMICDLLSILDCLLLSNCNSFLVSWMPINGFSSVHLCGGSFALIASGFIRATLTIVIISSFITWTNIFATIHLNGHHSPPSYTAPSCDDLSTTVMFFPHTSSHPLPTPASDPVSPSSSLSSESSNKCSLFTSPSIHHPLR